MNTSSPWHLQCVVCSSTYDARDLRYRCDCGGVLDVVHHATSPAASLDFDTIDRRRMSRDPLDRSGVWRFREWLLPLPESCIITKPEGNTNLYASEPIREWTGSHTLRLKHEGENPSGSFKDRGMTAGVSVAKWLGMSAVACASTGNTSASMASYAAQAGLTGYVFIPDTGVALGKLAQAVAYGATTIRIRGDFDAAMKLVQEVCNEKGIYLLNSVNPYRIEGQKAIGYELLEDLAWQMPDWLVLPGGNLGNNSAIYKGFAELKTLGLIDKLPRIAVIQATGANPLYTAWQSRKDVVPIKAATRATAIKIGAPVSWRKSLRGLHATSGLVEEVSDQEILDAKAVVDAAGIGAEPASCATVAGVKKLVEAGVIGAEETVCGILTGHVMKDPDIIVDYHSGQLDDIESNYANRALTVDPDLASVLAVLDA